MSTIVRQVAALDFVDGLGVGSTVTIVGSTISDNHANDGGGITW